MVSARMVVATRYSTNTPFFVAALLERWLCQEDRRYWARLAYIQSPFSLRDRSICFATSMELSRLWTALQLQLLLRLLVATFLPFFPVGFLPNSWATETASVRSTGIELGKNIVDEKTKGNRRGSNIGAESAVSRDITVSPVQLILRFPAHTRREYFYAYVRDSFDVRVASIDQIGNLQPAWIRRATRIEHRSTKMIIVSSVLILLAVMSRVGECCTFFLNLVSLNFYSLATFIRECSKSYS